jgi:hypothetical protein
MWAAGEEGLVVDRSKPRSIFVAEKSEDATVAKANLVVEHLKNIDIACDDARLSAVEKIRRVKEEVEKAKDCLKRLSLPRPAQRRDRPPSVPGAPSRKPWTVDDLLIGLLLAMMVPLCQVFAAVSHWHPYLTPFVTPRNCGSKKDWN